MIVDALHRLANPATAEQSQSLSREEARAVMTDVLSGKCTDAQIAALLVALRMKGETVEEIVGFAEAIRAAAAPLPIERNGLDPLAVSGTGRDALLDEPADDSLIDTSGTCGDASCTFNISTATALVTAGAGVRVAKHGNRSISSKCGSADVVEALGLNIQLSPERSAQCLREVGICFLYAPNLHPAMKQVQGVRRELRMRTMFNLLGPLTNPARASGQVVGVYSLELVEKLAEALSMLGLKRAVRIPILNVDPLRNEQLSACGARFASSRKEALSHDGSAHGSFSLFGLRACGVQAARRTSPRLLRSADGLRRSGCGQGSSRGPCSGL